MGVLGQVAVLFGLIVLGYVCAKIKLIDSMAADVLSPVIMNVTLPCMILVSFQRPFSGELLGEAGIALAASFVMYGVAFPLAFIYPRLLKMRGRERGVHRYAILFSNCGNLGYPVVEAILGAEYIFHASLFNMSFSFFAYSLGAWLLAKEGERKVSLSWRAFVNPAILATVVGFLLFLFSVTLPEVLARGLEMTGSVTSPLSMLAVGIGLARTDAKQIWGRWQIYVTVFIRLAALPFLVGMCCLVLGIRGSMLALTLIISAMPAAAITPVMASLYKSAPEEGGTLVFMTTLFSMVSIPLLALVINGFV
ncbi:MAG TPA: hypothetical protein DEQ14_10535 [Treponema sp.]|nr:hypothetical protein [Treponema sp.]